MEWFGDAWLVIVLAKHKSPIMSSYSCPLRSLDLIPRSITEACSGSGIDVVDLPFCHSNFAIDAMVDQPIRVGGSVAFIHIASTVIPRTWIGLDPVVN